MDPRGTLTFTITHTSVQALANMTGAYVCCVTHGVSDLRVVSHHTATVLTTRPAKWWEHIDYHVRAFARWAWRMVLRAWDRLVVLVFGKDA